MIHHVDVDLVSPAMIGGSRPRDLDEPLTLRPPSVRGQLRFWVRALSSGEPRSLETELFGSTETGQRIVSLPTLGSAGASDRPLFPRKDGKYRSVTRMIKPGAAFRLRFRIDNPNLVERFRAVLWTWLHLGTVGRRGRRGYGSLLWRPAEGDALEGFPVLDLGEALASREDLEAYLRLGLAEVRKRLGAPEEKGARATGGWFQLRCLDQVFVGERLSATYSRQVGGMEDLLHGLGGKPSSGEGDEMGRMGSERLASPMLWRVFPAAGGGYFTVMTWSPRGTVQLEEGALMHNYLLEKLSLSHSLSKELPLACPASTTPP